MRGSSDLSVSEQSKPAFDQVEPRAAGWSKVQMETRSFGQPAMNRSGFVRGIIVENQVNLKSSGYLGIDGVEELTKLDGSMPTMELTDDFTALGIEGGKQRGRAMTLIIMSAPLDLARSHG